MTEFNLTKKEYKEIYNSISSYVVDNTIAVWQKAETRSLFLHFAGDLDMSANNMKLYAACEILGYKDLSNQLLHNGNYYDILEETRVRAIIDRST